MSRTCLGELGGVDDKLCFVNLDMVFHKLTLEALRWFYPRISVGEGRLIHDYFDTLNFPNLKREVIEFAKEVGMRGQFECFYNKGLNLQSLRDSSLFKQEPKRDWIEPMTSKRTILAICQ